MIFIMKSVADEILAFTDLATINPHCDVYFITLIKRNNNHKMYTYSFLSMLLGKCHLLIWSSKKFRDLLYCLFIYK